MNRRVRGVAVVLAGLLFACARQEAGPPSGPFEAGAPPEPRTVSPVPPPIVNVANPPAPAAGASGSGSAGSTGVRDAGGSGGRGGSGGARDAGAGGAGGASAPTGQCDLLKQNCPGKQTACYPLDRTTECEDLLGAGEEALSPCTTNAECAKSLFCFESMCRRLCDTGANACGGKLLCHPLAGFAPVGVCDE